MERLYTPTDSGRRMPEGLETTRWLLWTGLRPELSEPEGPLSNSAAQSWAEVLGEVVIFTAYTSTGSCHSYGRRHRAAVRGLGADRVTAVVLGVRWLLLSCFWNLPPQVLTNPHGFLWRPQGCTALLPDVSPREGTGGGHQLMSVVFPALALWTLGRGPAPALIQITASSVLLY